jgi:hypothetical protein
MLRALGRFLDDVQAFGIEIVDQGDEWAVTWDRPGTMWLRHFQLDALREVARMNRGLEGDMPRLTTSQILRVLGHELDKLGAGSFTIRESGDGYALSAIAEGREVMQSYSLDEIRALWAERMQAR